MRRRLNGPGKAVMAAALALIAGTAGALPAGAAPVATGSPAATGAGTAAPVTHWITLITQTTTPTGPSRPVRAA
ncbi:MULTISPECIES: hypothetical protein [unclassified Streptomyces]|uniref:hypothetical protein n=1 Tax=unclassified Streptomyces TaxID=2593676 RepID=UPI0037F4805E